MNRSRRSRSLSEQAGFVAIEFVMGLGFLLLPVALLVSIMPTWSERQEMARVAAREAARTYVLTNDRNKATEIVNQISSNYALKDGTLTLELQGDPTQRGAEIKAIVHIKVPATNIPIMNADAPAFDLTEQHTEVVDLYRSAP